MTKADLKHCGMMPDASEESKLSVRDGRIQSRHCIRALIGWDQVDMTYKQN